jgi:hypothetical protein
MEGSGSYKNDTPLKIVPMKKEFQAWQRYFCFPLGARPLCTSASLPQWGQERIAVIMSLSPSYFHDALESLQVRDRHGCGQFDAPLE